MAGAAVSAQIADGGRQSPAHAVAVGKAMSVILEALMSGLGLPQCLTTASRPAAGLLVQMKKVLLAEYSEHLLLGLRVHSQSPWALTGQSDQPCHGTYTVTEVPPLSQDLLAMMP